MDKYFLQALLIFYNYVIVLVYIHMSLVRINTLYIIKYVE